MALHYPREYNMGELCYTCWDPKTELYQGWGAPSQELRPSSIGGHSWGNPFPNLTLSLKLSQPTECSGSNAMWLPRLDRGRPYGFCLSF